LISWNNQYLYHLLTDFKVQEVFRRCRCTSCDHQFDLTAFFSSLDTVEKQKIIICCDMLCFIIIIIYLFWVRFCFWLSVCFILLSLVIKDVKLGVDIDVKITAPGIEAMKMKN